MLTRPRDFDSRKNPSMAPAAKPKLPFSNPNPNPNPNPNQKQNHWRVWSEADETSLLRAAIAFRSARGSLPDHSTMADLTASIDTTKTFSPVQVYDKLRRLKSNYIASIAKPTHRKLLGELWGGGKSSEEEEVRLSTRSSKPVWTDGDELELLRGAIAFRHITGAIPKHDTMGEFLPYIKGYFSSSSFTEQMVYEKLRGLEERYFAAKVDDPERDSRARLVYDLSADVWGGKEFGASMAKEVGWTEDDEVELLRGAVAFGSVPNLETMGEFLPYVKGCFGAKSFTESQVFDKFRQLEERYSATNADGPDRDSRSRLVYKLSADVWGGKQFVVTTRKSPRAVKKNADLIVKKHANFNLSSVVELAQTNAKELTRKTEEKKRKEVSSSASKKGEPKRKKPDEKGLTTPAADSLPSASVVVVDEDCVMGVEVGTHSSQEPVTNPELLWTEDKEEEILRGAIAFRSVLGSIPKLETMGEFFPYIKGCLGGKSVTELQVFDKFLELEKRYYAANANVVDRDSPCRLVYELSADVWGGKEFDVTATKGPQAVDKEVEIRTYSSQEPMRSNELGWTADNEVELLKRAIVFRSLHGSMPNVETMSEFLPYIEGYLGGKSFTESQVFDKFMQLEERYFATNANDLNQDSHNRLFYELSSDVWGEKGVASVARKKKIWTDADEVVLLRGGIVFRATTCCTPGIDTIDEFLPFVKGNFSIPFTREQVYEKIMRLRKWYTDTSALDPILKSSHEHLIYELAVEVWGEKTGVTGSRKVWNDMAGANVVWNGQRPRTRRYSSDSTVVVKDVTVVPSKSPRPFERKWRNEDEVALLRGAISFRSFSGCIPKKSKMSEFLSHVRGCFSSHFTEAQVLDKLSRLKGQYLSTNADCLDANPHKRVLYEISSELWGCSTERIDAHLGAETVAKATIRNGNSVVANDSFPFMREAAAEYWKANSLSCTYLEKAWEKIDPHKCKLLEEKWRKFYGDVVKCHLSELDLNRELLFSLMDTLRD